MADAPTKTEEQAQAQAPASASSSTPAPAPAAPAVPPAKSAAAPAPAPPAEVASDPEEDDLSDLDDVLDEFANTKLDSKLKSPLASTAAPKSSGPGRPEDKDPADLLLEDEDAFAQQLQKEMEQLLGQGDFGKQFEDIMKEMSKEMGGADPLAALAGDVPAASKTAPKAKEVGSSMQADTATKAEKSFQDTIKKTMERMQSSGDAAGAAAASASQDDILAQMLASMESGGFGGEGSDEDFSKILMGMMEQLTNRDILYEPMKELNDKFPKWMEDHEGKVDEADMKRYKEQQVLVKEITGRFERKGYSDDDAGDREYIVERMQKMQAAGSPPPDLVGDMNAAQEALQEMDQGCPTQ